MILELETEIEELEKGFSSGFDGSDNGDAVKSYNDKKELVEQKYARWEELAALDQS